MKDNKKHLGLQLNYTLYYKLRYISNDKNRSLIGQVIYLIRMCIRDFERENGEIKVKSDISDINSEIQ